MNGMVRILPGVYIASDTDGAYDRRGRYLGEVGLDDDDRPVLVNDVTSLIDTGSDAFILGDCEPLLRLLDHLAGTDNRRRAPVAALCARLVRSAGDGDRRALAAAISDVIVRRCPVDAVAALRDLAMMAGDLAELAAVSAA